MESESEGLYLLQNSEQTGPFSRASVREMLDMGSISRTDHVWIDGMPEWVTVEDFFGLRPPESPSGKPAPQKKKKKGKRQPSTAAFGGVVGAAFAYPFRGYGWVTLLSGTLVLTLLEWFKMLPASPALLNVFMGVTAWGYLLLMLQSIIVQTAMGESDLPEWPEFTGFGELIVKALQWLVILLLCFGPGIFLSGYLMSDADDSSGVTELVLVSVVLFAGGAYFPMALLGVAMFDSLGAVNPMLVVRSILRVPGHYAIVLVLLGCAMGGLFLISMLTNHVPIIGLPLYQFGSLYGLMFMARVLGGMYAVNSVKLGWF